MAKCWATAMETIRRTYCFSILPPTLYMTEYSTLARGLYLIPKSLFPVVFTFEHQPCPHNRWLDMGLSLKHTCIVVHTPVTLTLREKRWASAGWGCIPDPLYPPFIPHSRPSGGSSFTKAPLNHRRTPWLWAFEPLKSKHSPAHSCVHNCSSPIHLSHLMNRGSTELRVQVLMGGWGMGSSAEEWKKPLISFLFLFWYETIRRAYDVTCALSLLVSLLNMYCSL